MSEINELDLLKQRATTLGIGFHPSIGVEALKAKVAAKLDDSSTNGVAVNGDGEPMDDGPSDQNDDPTGTGGSSPFNDPDEPAGNLTPLEAISSNSTPAKRLGKQAALQVERQKQMDEQMRLIRIRVACLNPVKKELQGEIFTFGNRILGEVKKFVPFGEGSENGYHVPFCIYNVIKDRKFVQLRSKAGRNGTTDVSQKIVSEFTVEVLDPLTPKEIASLAASQAAGHSID